MKKIGKWTLLYAFIKQYVFCFFRLYYRHFSINGLENFNKNKPIILAPNHQNALMDALTIVFSLPGQPVFLARADIFKNKIIASVLYALKLMPVFRIRDGKDSLVNNKDTFDTSISVLENNKVLCLFPEGAHIGMKSMLPHKKAVPRIAFLAGEKTNFEIDLQVIPVGIYYTHYYKFRSDLVVQYGKPIPMKEYFDIFRTEGEQKATQALRDKIYDELSLLCVNVPDKDDYPIYEQGFELYREKECKLLKLKTTPTNMVKAEQSLTAKLKCYLDEHLSEKERLLKAASACNQLKEKLSVSEESLKRGQMKWFEVAGNLIVFIILLPFSLFGAILHGWLFCITTFSIRKKIKDPQFYSSFTLGLNVVFFTLWFIILLLIFAFTLHNWIIAIVLVIVSIPCGIIAWEITQMILSMCKRFKCKRLNKKRNIDYKMLLENRDYLVYKFDKIII